MLIDHDHTETPATIRLKRPATIAEIRTQLFLTAMPVPEQPVPIVQTVVWSVVLLGWSNVLVSAMREWRRPS